MISILNSISELEKSERLRQVTSDCYLSAIRSVAQYAVELDPQSTEQYRTYVNALAVEVEKSSAETLRESRATLRGLLRRYRDQASAYLDRLRDELATTAASLKKILESLSQTEGDHELRLRQALKTLRELSNSAGGSVGAALKDTAQAIERSLEQLHNEQQMTIAQLLVEIGLLHKRIDALESAASVDSMTRLFTRPEIEDRIRAAESGGSLLMISVQGFRRAAVHFNPTVAEELAGAFIKRLRNSVLPEAFIGRWGEEEFIVITPSAKSDAITAARWVAEHLSGAYACLQNGKSVRPAIQVNVAVLEFKGEDNPEHTLRQVGKFLTGSVESLH